MPSGAGMKEMARPAVSKLSKGHVRDMRWVRGILTIEGRMGRSRVRLAESAWGDCGLLISSAVMWRFSAGVIQRSVAETANN